MMYQVKHKQKLADFQPDDLIMSFKKGAKFKDMPPNPIELTWNPENESGTKASYYSSGKVLMTKQLVEALYAAGVNNIDVYPVIIHSTLGAKDCSDYVAVNIVGAIEAVDREKSEFIYDSGGLFDNIFARMILDESKINRVLLFRLAEAISTVIVHESVVKTLESMGDFGLTFIKSDEYAG